MATVTKRPPRPPKPPKPPKPPQAPKPPRPKSETDWNTVNWRKANKVVKNLRQRIFKASRQGDLKKVRSLQKLMLRSYSNRLVAVRRVTQVNAGKYTPGTDKLVVKTPERRAWLVDWLANYEPWKAKPA